MSDINSVVIIGRATRDGELKYTNGGTAVLNFSIACNRSIPPKDGGEWKNEPTFIDVQAWGKLAETKAPLVKKGKLIGVGGEIRQDRWEKDGQSHSKLYVVVSSIQILADPKGKDEPGIMPKEEAPKDKAVRKSPYNPDGSMKDEFENDIPF